MQTLPGSPFAALYERYEERAFNLAYRIVGSEADAADAVQRAFLEVVRGLPALTDGEPALGSYLFAETRKACHDLMQGRPGMTAQEPAAGADDREIREANMRLPERQRGALALRELEGLSYDEIAGIVEVSRGSVPQLLSRGRINLSDELHGTTLASVAAPLPECERALPLIAARDDAQLDPGSPDAAWLDAHLTGCERCRLAVGAMRKASASYRAWPLIAAVPWLFKDTMAKAAQLTGADWSEGIATAASRHRTRSLAGTPADRRMDPDRPKPPRRRVALAAGLTTLLLLAGLAAAFAGNDPPTTPVDSATGTPLGPSVAGEGRSAHPVRARKAKGTAAKKATNVETHTEEAAQVQIATGGDSVSEPASPKSHSGKAGVQPTQATSAPKPSAKPKPASTPTPTSTTTEAPPPEETEKTHGRAEPPGKPADRPPPK